MLSLCIFHAFIHSSNHSSLQPLLHAFICPSVHPSIHPTHTAEGLLCSRHVLALVIQLWRRQTWLHSLQPREELLYWWMMGYFWPGDMLCLIHIMFRFLFLVCIVTLIIQLKEKNKTKQYDHLDFYLCWIIRQRVCTLRCFSHVRLFATP